MKKSILKNIVRATMGWFYRPILLSIRKKKKQKRIKVQTEDFIQTVKNIDSNKQRG